MAWLIPEKIETEGAGLGDNRRVSQRGQVQIR